MNTVRVPAASCNPGDKILEHGKVLEVESVNYHSSNSFLMTKMYESRHLYIQFYKNQVKVDKVIG